MTVFPWSLWQIDEAILHSPHHYPISTCIHILSLITNTHHLKSTSKHSHCVSLSLPSLYSFFPHSCRNSRHTASGSQPNIAISRYEVRKISGFGLCFKSFDDSFAILFRVQHSPVSVYLCMCGKIVFLWPLQNCSLRFFLIFIFKPCSWLLSIRGST